MGSHCFFTSCSIAAKDGAAHVASPAKAVLVSARCQIVQGNLFSAVAASQLTGWKASSLPNLSSLLTAVLKLLLKSISLMKAVAGC